MIINRYNSTTRPVNDVSLQYKSIHIQSQLKYVWMGFNIAKPKRNLFILLRCSLFWGMYQNRQWKGKPTSCQLQRLQVSVELQVKGRIIGTLIFNQIFFLKFNEKLYTTVLSVGSSFNLFFRQILQNGNPGMENSDFPTLGEGT